MRLGVATAITAMAAFLGCGGGGGSSSSSRSAAEGPPPSSLVGTYATTLKPSDVSSNAPPELTPGGWTVKIAKTGGPGNGPTLTISGDQQGRGALESPTLGVSGKTLFLSRRSAPTRPARITPSSTAATTGLSAARPCVSQTRRASAPTRLR